MKRKDFLKLIPVAGVSPFILSYAPERKGIDPRSSDDQHDKRAYWVTVMEKIGIPVLHNLAEGKLKINMPVESTGRTGKRLPIWSLSQGHWLELHHGLNWDRIIHLKAYCVLPISNWSKGVLLRLLILNLPII